MTTILERPSTRPATAAAPPVRRPLAVLLCIVALTLAAGSVALASDLGTTEVARGVQVVVWALAGLGLAVRRPGEPLGLVVAAGAALGGAASIGASVASDPAAGAREAGELVRIVTLALVPGAGAHLVMGLPDGRLLKSSRRGTAVALHAFGGALGVGLWLARPASAWPIAAFAVVAALVAASVSSARYRRAKGLERQRMQWFGWAVTLGATLAVVAGALRILVSWPTDAAPVAMAATLAIPLSLTLASSDRFITRVDRLLEHTVAIAGLIGLVVGVYLVVVVGLGRVPTSAERTLLTLSMVAAAIAALLYSPTRARLNALATRVVYGERHAPDEVLRTFGSRMSRAVPMDELLLQAAESLRKTFALDSVEIWTGQAGSLERTVSLPERGRAHMTIGAKEIPVLARAGVTGPAWIKVWLPEVLRAREDSMVRLAPVSHQGEVLGMIVVERYRSADLFGEEEERVLTELARTIGIALHNVQLDSALQATLDEVRTQAEELRESRKRVVAAGDAERRKIEANIHDGAQQHLVALKVKLRLAQQLVAKDTDQATAMIQQLSEDVQATIDEVRALSHGVYPRLLADRGLVPALDAAAARQVLPTSVDASIGERRYGEEIEAAVYFCCLEAMQNAMKHAGEGTQVRIRVREEAGALLFDVSDDGPGVDLAARGLGAGYTNMSDRIGAVGGTVVWDSAPGRGMTVSGRIPLA